MNKERYLPLSAPRIENSAWTYVKDCLDTEWVSSVGRYVGGFEDSVRAFTGSKHAIAAVNGTSALHLSLQLAGLGPGDLAVVPALTFIATANAVAYTGARCLFADCEPGRFNVDLDKLEESLAKRRGKRPKVFVATHILGYPMDMDRVAKLAKRFGMIVVEDAAESIGSYWRGRHTGTFGRLGALSFNGNKIITTGGGGMILTQDDKLGKRAKHLTQQAKASALEYVHDAVGYNYRLTNVLAALGVSQMESLPGFLAKREEIARWYRAELPGVPVEPELDGAKWNRWLLSVELEKPADRDRAMKALEAAGCQSRPLWRPVPLQKPYKDHESLGHSAAKAAYARALNVPSSTSLEREDVARVCRVLETFAVRRLLA